MMHYASNPFVGLRPFESDESLLFFGRQKQVMELLERLHRHQFVAITGSSGCGKSSLIRAGLIPKLKAGYLVDDRDEWVISLMKPGETPILNMAAAILEQLPEANTNIDSLQKKIGEQGADAVLELLNPLWKKNFNFFLLVDQFEELFSDSNQVQLQAGDEAINFVNVLLDLSAQKELPVYIVITMRSDYIGDCAQFYGLPEALNESQYVVPRLNRLQLKSAIEGPVRLTAIKIHPGLTERLLNDARNIKVELPLLQHVLLRIWEQEKNINKNGELDLEDYGNIGGIEEALSNHAKEALESLNEEQKGLAKKIFQSLTRIDEKGRRTRRRVHLAELVMLTGKTGAELLSVIDRFNEDGRSFLVISKVENSHDLLIDISHESLIAEWDDLNKWVDEEAESARTFSRLAENAALYKRNARELMRGNELHPMSHWLNSFKPDGVWARRYHTDFENSVWYLKESEKEEKRQMLKRRLNRRLRFALALFVILLVSAFAIVLFIHNIKRKKELVLGYWYGSQASRSSNDYSGALHFIAEAGILNEDEKTAQDLLIDGEIFLPRMRLAAIFPQPALINSAVFDSSGKFLLIASNDNRVRMLDRETGKVDLTLQFGAPVNSAVFSADGKWILTASNDNTVCSWDKISGKKIGFFEHPAAVTSAVFSKDRQYILSACADGYARILDVLTGSEVRSFQHPGALTSAVFSADEKTILTACTSGDVFVWDLTGKKTHSFYHAQPVNSAVYSNDEKEVLTSCDDGNAYTWDIATGKQTGILHHDGPVTGAVFSPRGQWILTSGKDKKSCLWDAASKKQTGAGMQDDGPVYSAVFSADEKWIVTGGWDKTIRVWQVAIDSSAPANRFHYPHKANSAFFSPDDKNILITRDDTYAHIINAETGKPVRSLLHKAPVSSAIFNADGKNILTVTADSSFHLWNAEEEKEIGFLKLPALVLCAVFSPDGKLVITGSTDNYVRVFDASKIPLENCIDSVIYKGDIQSAIISADHKKILVAGTDSTARLIDVVTRKEIGYFKHDDTVNGALFSPDEKWILTFSSDKTASVWDSKSGKQAGTPMKHAWSVSSAVFSPDGKWILTADYEKTSHLWNTATLKQIGPGIRHTDGIGRAVFNHAGKKVLNTGAETVAVGEIEADLDMPADLFKLQARAITGAMYDLHTNQTKCLSPDKWIQLNEQYEKQAEEHLRSCKYAQYNLWRRFK